MVLCTYHSAISEVDASDRRTEGREVWSKARRSLSHFRSRVVLIDGRRSPHTMFSLSAFKFQAAGTGARAPSRTACVIALRLGGGGVGRKRHIGLP